MASPYPISLLPQMYDKMKKPNPKEVAEAGSVKPAERRSMRWKEVKNKRGHVVRYESADGSVHLVPTECSRWAVQLPHSPDWSQQACYYLADTFTEALQEGEKVLKSQKEKKSDGKGHPD